MNADLEKCIVKIKDLSDSLTMMAFGIEYHGGNDKAVGPGLHVVADQIRTEANEALDILCQS